MKGKKRVVSRKRQALRWTAVLVLLVWLSHTTGAYCLTPTRVLRSLEREQRTLWRRRNHAAVRRGPCGDSRALCVALEKRLVLQYGWLCGALPGLAL